MNKYNADKIRNIALASHSGTGKTSILESMLYNTKIITIIIKLNLMFKDLNSPKKKRRSVVFKS